MPLRLNAAQRSQRARLAVLASHRKGKTNTGPAKAAADARFRKQVLNEATARGEVLTEAEVERRASFARREFYARISYESLKARSRNKKAASVSDPPAAKTGGHASDQPAA